MSRVCQALIASFAFPATVISVLIGVPAVSSFASPLFVEVSVLSDQPFPALVLDNPGHAAVLLAIPGGLGKRLPVPSGIDSNAIALRVGARLQTLLPGPVDADLAVALVAGERRGVGAFSHGGMALLVVPSDGSADVEEVASAAAQALVASALAPAAPVEAIGEPLLALAEAIGHSGVIALASLPASLRPVSGWQEVATARGALEGFVAEALDERTPWTTRRARLVGAGRPGGAPPTVAQAAAGLLECLGRPAELATRPLALLEAWSRYEGKRCPKMPRILRRALTDPVRAGFPPATARSEIEAVRSAARERLVAAGTVSPLPSGDFSLAQTLVLAARARSAGGADLCPWLGARTIASWTLTGCRGDEPREGWLLSRPLPGHGFEIAWVAQDGRQHPVVVWPRWVLSPTLCRHGSSVCFIDPHGVWSVSLDGRTPPVLFAAGSFRLLAASPDGVRLAAACWPEAEVWLADERGAGVRIPVSGHAGLGWVDGDVLAVADGTHIGLFSSSGEGRAAAVTSPGTTAIAARPGCLFLAASTPSGPVIERVDLGTGQRERLTMAPGDVSSLHASPDGSLIMATCLGLWRWRPGETALRFSDGLAVGQ
ncbi:MAG: hypothetical protein KA072_02315 [Thermoanaerobaculaceae bacterium]|nr:hypothetical protein [Thermoanaerobaculaceae bacterium]MDI9621537.1 hypothetical protein [Acidobacteriota bacterium]NLH11530.1 hypothetical protein [Holophagae bacterium]HPW55166.1 hypothetical protein [Thermoanaerobaculaceae bacterium]